MRLTGTFIRSTTAALLVASLNPIPAWAEIRARSEEVPFLPAWCGSTPHVTNEEADYNPTPDRETAALIAKFNRTGCRGIWHACWAMALRSRGIAHQLEGTQEGYWYHEALSNFAYVLKRARRRAPWSRNCMPRSEKHMPFRGTRRPPRRVTRQALHGQAGLCQGLRRTERSIRTARRDGQGDRRTSGRDQGQPKVQWIEEKAGRG